MVCFIFKWKISGDLVRIYTGELGLSVCLCGFAALVVIYQFNKYNNKNKLKWFRVFCVCVLNMLGTQHKRREKRIVILIISVQK